MSNLKDDSAITQPAGQPPDIFKHKHARDVGDMWSGEEDLPSPPEDFDKMKFSDATLKRRLGAMLCLETFGSCCGACSGGCNGLDCDACCRR